MKTIFIVGKDKLVANIQREFHEGDPFQMNGVPHNVVSVLQETTHRVVHLVEAPIEPDIRDSHSNRRSRKTFAGAER